MVKNTIKALILVSIFWLPTGMPDDFIIIPAIIKTIGFQMYIIISITIAYLLYTTIDGKTLSDKFRNIRKEIKSIISG